jgi:thiosulfate/3-mercaptopyruvate sulfurtransferase
MSLSLPKGPIVTTAWLAEHLRDPQVRVLDVRGKVLPVTHPGSRYLAKREDYEAGHIPGAVFVDWLKDFVDLDDPGHVMIAKPAAFARRCEELGIGGETVVVTYDDYDAIFAGRIAWAFRYYGHDAVRILDGGLPAWVREKRPVTTEIACAARLGPAFVSRARPSLYRTADDVARALGREGTLLVDARAAEQFEGRASAAKRAGHIPGAKNVPYAKLIDPETGRFAAPDRLRAIFAEHGVDVAHLPEEVVVYCNGGVSATTVMHALMLAGRDEVALYDGSWNEWGNDPRRPIE